MLLAIVSCTLCYIIYMASLGRVLFFHISFYIGVGHVLDYNTNKQLISEYVYSIWVQIKYLAMFPFLFFLLNFVQTPYRGSSNVHLPGKCTTLASDFLCIVISVKIFQACTICMFNQEAMHSPMISTLQQ